jgi:hypothetical protein
MDSRQLVRGKEMKNFDVEGLITELVKEKDLPEGVNAHIHMDYEAESSSSAPDSPRQELVYPETVERSIDYSKDDADSPEGDPCDLLYSELAENDAESSIESR